jgi:hypothetical protein
MQVGVFWVLTPCSVVVGYQRLRGSCFFHHQGEVTSIGWSSETVVSYHKITRRHIPEDLDLNSRKRFIVQSFGTISKRSTTFTWNIFGYGKHFTKIRGQIISDVTWRVIICRAMGFVSAMNEHKVPWSWIFEKPIVT